uniref:B-cell receptor CD22 first Ig-like domain-containing protein n=1 Tax=Mastacembelus armatus TaxID=205130 RepID=A0A7N8X000_9TELE
MGHSGTFTELSLSLLLCCLGCERIQGRDTEVQKEFWFTKWTNTEPVDLKTQSEYSGRVQYQCDDKTCTLTIRDLRETDSAQYKFRFITNQQSGRYTGSPGVTLTVTGKTGYFYISYFQLFNIWKQ